MRGYQAGSPWVVSTACVEVVYNRVLSLSPSVLGNSLAYLMSFDENLFMVWVMDRFGVI